ncbi:MAG: Periplasmic pH-dependent serine endoprotease DegQ, partial [Acidimicrobiales bacterium]|nr:Periplasmic pH-dependent serine endoprotease DegQ [Acidimicrobiales bacterium]
VGAFQFTRSHSAARPSLAAGAAAPGTTTPTVPSAPAGGSAGGSSNGSSTSALDTAAIVAAVTPATVDITTSLGAGNGSAAGSGIILTSDGEVLTNRHVIEGARTISAQVGGVGRTYTATVLGSDATQDVALIKLQGASGLTVTKTSTNVAIGDAVVAIGNALGRNGPPAAVTGTVQAVDQTITVSDPSTGADVQMNGLIQTDAPLQPGDSGGPLINGHGQIIGMDAAASGGRRRSTGTEGFAIPIGTALTIAHQIERGESSSTVQIGAPAFLGVEVTNTADGSGGAAVANVETNTPAANAGLQAGDTIISFDGGSVTSAASLGPLIRQHKPGDKVTVVWVDSAGTRHSASVRLATGPAA